MNVDRYSGKQLYSQHLEGRGKCCNFFKKNKAMQEREMSYDRAQIEGFFIGVK